MPQSCEAALLRLQAVVGDIQASRKQATNAGGLSANGVDAIQLWRGALMPKPMPRHVDGIEEV